MQRLQPHRHLRQQQFHKQLCHKQLGHKQLGQKECGAVLIITLWTITLLTILVTVLAGQNRLSARVAQFHQEDLGNWANELAALNQAEMEIMLDVMDPPVLSVDEQLENPVNPRYRNYRGAELQLAWPQADDIVVRIQDHAGKINLTEISRPRLRAMLEYKLGEDVDTDQLDELMSAWADWLDLNAQPSPAGAESEYYGEQELPYEARNGRMETVEEILEIRGFGAIFADVELDAAFTLYGDSDLVNLNLATVEAMRLLPGLDEELIDTIVAWREDHEFLGNGDVAQLVPAERMAELRPWLNSRRVTNHYSIMAYQRQTPDNGPTTAYAEIVEINSFADRPRVLKINPYQTIPVTKIVINAEELAQ